MAYPSDILPLLEVYNISKDFSGVYALKDVSIEVFPGKVNALIGENGAGKSTLMKIVSGVYHDYTGKILLNQQELRFASPKDAMNNGVVIIHQELNLFPDLTVAENLFLGQEPVNRFGFIDYRELHRKTKELLGRLQLSIDPSTRIRQLRVGQQQLVEIARALLFDSRVLIMDEPTSAISDHEVQLLFRIINDLKAKGVAIVYISHKLDELFDIADIILNLRVLIEVDNPGQCLQGILIFPLLDQDFSFFHKGICFAVFFPFRNVENTSDFLTN